MPNWLKVIFGKAETEPVEILIYDEIGKDWMTNDGIGAQEFSDELKKISPTRDLVVGINSPGGNVWDGLAIHNMLANWKGNVTTRVDGVAASIASVILMAGKTRQSNQAASVMIHRAMAGLMGHFNADELRDLIPKLEAHDDLIAGIYSRRTGATKEAMLQAMAAETWYNGDEALKSGFIDSLLQKPNIKNCIRPETLKLFKNAPAALSTTTPPTPPQIPTSNMRKQLETLLNEWGVKFEATATDDQLLNLVKANANKNGTVIIASNPDDGMTNRLAALEARLAKERENNLTRRLDQCVLDNKITVEESKAMKELCLADPSDKFIAALEARQPVLPGASPIATPNIQFGNAGARDHVMAMKTPRERYQFMLQNYSDLLNSGYKNPRQKPIMPGIQNANTTDAALVTDFLVNGFTTVLQNQLAMLSVMTKEVETDRMKPKALIRYRKITAGGTAQSNATSFEDTTNFVGTEDKATITPAQITAGAHLTNVERQNGVSMAQWMDIKAAEFADKIASLRNVPIAATTFTATPVVSSAAAFGSDDLAILWGRLKKSSIHNIALDGEYYARFLPTDRFDFDVTGFRNRGWDNFVMDTNWSGADANTVGFACNPQAMVVGVGLPLRDPLADLVSRETLIPIPSLGITVALYEWYSNITRTQWATIDIVIGFAANDTTAGVLIKSA